VNREFTWWREKLYEKQCERNDQSTDEYAVSSPRQRFRRHGVLCPDVSLEKQNPSGSTATLRL